MAGLMAASGLLVAAPQPAEAAINRPLLLPFSAGETWCIYQGYYGVTHSRYELDIVYGSCC